VLRAGKCRNGSRAEQLGAGRADCNLTEQGYRYILVQEVGNETVRIYEERSDHNSFWQKAHIQEEGWASSSGHVIASFA